MQYLQQTTKENAVLKQECVPADDLMMIKIKLFIFGIYAVEYYVCPIYVCYV